MTRVLTVTVAFAIGSLTAFAQGPTFDVVSIKRNTSSLPGPRWGGTPARWEMINGPVSSLIQGMRIKTDPHTLGWWR